MKSDFDERGRVYFPGVDFTDFKEDAKRLIEVEVSLDFEKAYEGIKQLPAGSRSGVMLAYSYYLRLFQQIKKSPAFKINETRIRVSDFQKLTLLLETLAVKNFSQLLS